MYRSFLLCFYVRQRLTLDMLHFLAVEIDVSNFICLWLMFRRFIEIFLVFFAFAFKESRKENMQQNRVTYVSLCGPVGESHSASGAPCAQVGDAGVSNLNDFQRRLESVEKRISDLEANVAELAEGCSKGPVIGESIQVGRRAVIPCKRKKKPSRDPWKEARKAKK